MLLQDIARSLYPRQAIQQMFQPYIARAVKQRGVICGIAAGEDSVIDRDWPPLGQLRQDRDARLLGDFIRERIRRAQIEIIALI
jgi:hypothetical protein